jgi:DivIVA domain-containing protein
VELDRQSIERRDFPIGRRGYDPAAVDAHLRSLAAAVEELERSLGSRGSESLGSAAATQVQSILEAAEATAANIERQAADEARAEREAALHDAERTRSEAVARAQAHVQAVSVATAVLLERVESMDGEVGALVQSLRAGAGRLAADLTALEGNMGELYDAASSSSAAVSGGELGGVEESSLVSPAPVSAEPVQARAPASPSPAAPAVPAPAARTSPSPRATGGTGTAAAKGTAPVANGSASRAAAPVKPAAPVAQPGEGGEDLDGARLIALNMALNGEPRAEADRYLANHFELADRAQLLDEVYAAIEG